MSGVALAACGATSRKASSPAPTPPTAPVSTTTLAPPAPTTTGPPNPIAPLTGLPEPTAGQAGAVAVVVKVDNVDAARPQSGIGQADVVYEEMVEGGLSRLAAVFQSRYPTSVGPVRSGRTTDTGIADDLARPVYAYSGANSMFGPILRRQPVYTANDANHGELFVRKGPFPSPHNLYASVPALAGAANGKGVPPSPLFTYRAAGAAFAGAGITSASLVALSFPAASVTWRWDAGKGIWDRSQNGTPDLDNAGQLGAANVIIQSTSYTNDGYATGEGLARPTPIPKGQMVGRGRVWVLSDQHVVEGTWTRSALTGVTTYLDSTGQAIQLAPGVTWVELLPTGSSRAFTP